MVVLVTGAKGTEDKVGSGVVWVNVQMVKVDFMVVLVTGLKVLRTKLAVVLSGRMYR